MDRTDAERSARAERRRERATIHRGRLGSAERDLGAVRGAEAVSLVAQLTREGWSESGQPMPAYRRPDIPVRFVPRQGA